MTNEVATLSTGNYAQMAKAMGMSLDTKSGSSKSSSLPRLRIWNQPVMGSVEVKGKMKNMEVVPAGMYRLQMPDDSCVYAETAEIRVFVQRFMYKRYDSVNKTYVKTTMSDELNGDLKDNKGGFNCGKPAGYIKDFQSLPDDTKTLLKQIKRVRVLLGEVRLVNPVDAEGNDTVADVQPFIWEIDNRDAFKTMGIPFTQLAKERKLPVQHHIVCGSEENKLPTGASFYLPSAKLNLADSIELADDDEKKFTDYIEWIGNYNEYIVKTWNEITQSNRESLPESVVSEMIDVDEDENA